MKDKHKRYIRLVLILAWMGILFYFSHQDIVRSKGLSFFISDKILRVFSLDMDNLPRLDHYVRKSGHFIAYMFLSILIIRFFISRGYGLGKSISLSILLSLIFAATDEFHQLFVDGRRGSVKDIIIDTAGAVYLPL